MTKLLYRIILVKSFYDFSFLFKDDKLLSILCIGRRWIAQKSWKIEAEIGKRNPNINIKVFLSYIKSKEGDENGSTYNIFSDNMKNNS